jgi:hypothetical protein
MGNFPHDFSKVNGVSVSNMVWIKHNLYARCTRILTVYKREYGSIKGKMEEEDVELDETHEGGEELLQVVQGT